MKKNLTALFAALLLLAGTTFAKSSNTAPSAQIQNEFNRIFIHASNVVWQPVSSLYKVTFLQEGQYLTAFFNPAGRIESVARNISPGTLPLILQKDLLEKLKTAWIVESFELSGRNGTEYYVTLENANAKSIYRASGNGWTLYKKISK